MHFLNMLGQDFNITLFHYRNHGAAEGLVLVGFDIKEADSELFREHLEDLDYPATEHTNDNAYQFSSPTNC